MRDENSPDDAPLGPAGPRQYYVAAPDGPPSTTSAGVVRARPESPAQEPPPNRRASVVNQAPGGDGAVAPTVAPRNRRPRTGRRRWYRPKLRWLVLYLPVAVLLLIGGGLWWGWAQINGLYRVDLEDALATPSGDIRNYLIVGSDSREGLDADVANAGAIGLDVAGRRSDTLIVLRLEGSTAKMMSIPRDLWITNARNGKQGRINATYRDGPANLVRTITNELGIPIHHYVEVDFKSFSGMVDAMGGITIEFENPAYDKNSGLNVLRAGPARLDGSQALAFVRSRHYVEIVDGGERSDPTADLGRQQRQQAFIRSMLSEVGATRNPVTLARIAGAATSGMRVDEEFGFGDTVDLGRRLGGTDPESVLLPTTPATKGGASVLILQPEAAAPVLTRFGATAG